jgi:hypothetical protein
MQPQTMARWIGQQVPDFMMEFNQRPSEFLSLIGKKYSDLKADLMVKARALFNEFWEKPSI